MKKRTLTKGKEWRNKRMANGKPKPREDTYRRDGLSNHTRHQFHKAIRQDKLDRLREAESEKG